MPPQRKPVAGRGAKHREHRPDIHGPRLFRRGRYFGADLRPWGGQRQTLRDPKAKGWPEKGARTEDLGVAEKWRWSYVDLHREGTRRQQLGLPPAKRETLKALGERWIDHREHTVAEKTWVSSRTVVRRLVEMFGESATIADVDADRLQGEFFKLMREGYEVSTLHTEKNFMSAFFKWAGGDNPARSVVLPRVVEKDIHAWSDEEMKALRKAADKVDRQLEHPKARLALELAVATGARQQELFALDWSMISEKQESVRISRQLSRTTGNKFMPLKGKNNRTAYVLDSWWKWHDRKAKGLILHSGTGGTMGYKAAGNLAQRILDTADLNGRGRGWHDFRRTYGRLYLEGGGWLDELQRFLGHKSIATTERAYAAFKAEQAVNFARERRRAGGRSVRILK
jgi:integrase